MKRSLFALAVACAMASLSINVANIAAVPPLPLPEVYIAATVPETLEPSADTHVGPGEFTITRVGSTNESLILFVEFTGTATFGEDYQETSQFLTMPAGARNVTILVGPLNDSAVEGDETVIATLSTNPPINSLPNYRVHSRLNQATVTIHDNDFPNDLPVVSITGPSVVPEFCPPNADCAGISFSLRRTGPELAQPLTVFLLYRGTALPDVDYRSLPQQVTFEAGRDLAVVSSVPIDDTLYEGDETIIAYIIENFAHYIDPNRSQATTVIRDNDLPAPPVVSLELVRREAAETLPYQNAIFWGEFRVLRTGPATQELLVYLNTAQGSAKLGVDYWLDGLTNGSAVRIPAGTNAASFRVYPIDDNIYEGDETVLIHLVPPAPGGGPYGIDAGHSSVEMVIHDNDPPGTVVSIRATSVIAEEDSSPLDRLNLVGVFTVSRSGPTNASLPVYLQYSGSATPGVDYPALPWLVSIPAGANAVEIRVVPIADNIPEGIETLNATISNCPAPGLLPPCYDFEIDHISATIFLRDDGLTRSSLTITKPKEGANFAVDETILIDATAIDLDGYISHVEFFDGNELIGESDIVFFRAPDPGTPIYHSIYWHGGAPGIHLLTARAVSTLGTAISSVPVRITVGPVLNQPPQVAISRPVSGAAFPLDTAIEIVAATRDPDGYVRKVEFFADGRKIGESSVEFIRAPDPGQPQTFTFLWHQTDPGRHALTARATDDDGAMATSTPVEIQVAMAEPLPIVTVSAPDPFAVEPHSNTNLNTAMFRIRRHGPTNEALVVAYTLHGTAQNGTDYEMLSGLATIPAAHRTINVIVRALADNLSEGLESVLLRLEEPPPPSPVIGVINPYRVGQRALAAAVISDGPWVAASGGAQCLALPGSLMHVCFAAEAARNFRVEASGDLRNWETLFDTVGSDGTWHFVDDDMGNHPRRYYRLSPEPVMATDE